MPSGQFTEIPILDLSAIDGRAALADEIREICHEIGFFVVTHHGVDPALVHDGLRHDADVLRPARVRQAAHRQAHVAPLPRAGNRSGPSRRTTAPTSASRSTCGPSGRRATPMSSRRTSGCSARTSGSPTRCCRDTASSSSPGSASSVPSPIGCCDSSPRASAWHRTILSNYFGDEPMSLTKLISYPPTPLGGAGVNAHHDTGFLTVLAAGTTPGLQVANTDGEWIDVPIVPDSFVINLGEIMQAITGNYFVATPHRVITAEPRLSAAYFHGPSLDTRLDPLPLDPRFAEAVAASPRHRDAGFMAGPGRDRGRRRRHAQPAPAGHLRRTVVELLRPQLPRQHGPPSTRASESDRPGRIEAEDQTSAARASRRRCAIASGRWPSR